MYRLTYNQEARSFSKEDDDKKAWNKYSLKTALIVSGIGLAINVLPKVLNMVASRNSRLFRDKLLTSKNEDLNNLYDNYNKKGMAAQSDPASVKKYNLSIHKLYKDTLSLLQTSGEYNPDDTIYKNYITPFLGVLRLILIKPVHISTGTALGADRRNFELIFDPDHTNPEDAIRNPFRETIYSHKWPANGFEVTSMNAKEANELISDCINWLSKNSKYLTIRV